VKPALGAAIAASILALAALGRHARRAATPDRTRPVGAAPSARAALCPAGTLPDEGVCIPVPRRVALAPRAPADAEGRIARRPDRPADYLRYVLPFEARAVEAPSLGGDDGGLSPGSVVLVTPAGTVVHALTLEGQDGPATALFAGPLVGLTVVTQHVVETGGRRRVLLVVLGNLATVSVVAHATVSGSDVLGTTGGTPLSLAVRAVRDGIDVDALSGPELLDDANSVPEDARNVLVVK
jgi:hypothetical protein